MPCVNTRSNAHELSCSGSISPATIIVIERLKQIAPNIYRAQVGLAKMRIKHLRSVVAQLPTAGLAGVIFILVES